MHVPCKAEGLHGKAAARAGRRIRRCHTLHNGVIVAFCIAASGDYTGRVRRRSVACYLIDMRAMLQQAIMASPDVAVQR